MQHGAVIGLQSANISYLVQFELFLKISLKIPTHLTVILLWDDSSGCDEVDDTFATEADAMIDIISVHMT